MSRAAKLISLILTLTLGLTLAGAVAQGDTAAITTTTDASATAATTTTTSTETTPTTTAPETTTTPTTTVVTTTVEHTTTRVVPVLPTTTTGTTNTSSEGDENATPTWVWVLLGILAVALVALIVLLARRGGGQVGADERRRQLDAAVASWTAQGWAIQSGTADSAVLQRGSESMLVGVDQAGHANARPLPPAGTHDQG
jgi:hypothetical protein